MPLIDTHAHIQIDRFDADRDEVLRRAREAGLERIIVIGYDLPSSHAAVALAADHPLLAAAAGIQPHYAQATGADHLEQLRALLQRPQVVALGEIGLDYYHDRAPRPAQHELFRKQLAIAREYMLPVVIHSREAQTDTVRILSESAHGLTVVMHAFSGDWSYAEACLELGAYLSLAGPVTFPKATELHAVARRVPLERLLIETDCPYLSPHPFRGQRNEPAHVRLVAEQIAALRGIPVDELIEATWNNAHNVFRSMNEEL